MKKNIFVLNIFFSFSLALFAQKSPHEFSVSAGGIVTKMNYDLSKGTDKTGTGGALGLGYRYYMNPRWSIGTGIEYQSFQSNILISQLSDRYQITDAEGDNFEFRYKATNYNESQSAQFISIPVNAQYETQGIVRFYASAGIKIGFVLASEYETKIDNLSTSGYYDQWNVELFDPQFMGFGEWDDINSGKQDLDLKTLFIISAESGVKQSLSEKSDIYIGFYLDYGINDIQPEQKHTNPVTYNTGAPEEFILHSLSTSTDSKATRFSDGLNLISFGAKIRFAFH